MSFERAFISGSVSIVNPIWNGDRSSVIGGYTFVFPLLVYMDAIFKNKLKRKPLYDVTYNRKIDHKEFFANFPDASDEYWNNRDLGYEILRSTEQSQSIPVKGRNYRSFLIAIKMHFYNTYSGSR